jgi:hypothetical protein
VRLWLYIAGNDGTETRMISDRYLQLIVETEAELVRSKRVLRQSADLLQSAHAALQAARQTRNPAAIARLKIDIAAQQAPDTEDADGSGAEART